MDKLHEKLADIPKLPGVYQFLDNQGEVLYIGKAKNLRARVSQYINGQDEREQIPFLMQEAADISYTVVNNELESLFLENTLIKKYLPRYNIMLRDDKNYAFIEISYSTEIPQIGYTRKIDPQSGVSRQMSAVRYFGPYSAAYKIRNTLHLMRRIFPYCAAEKVSGRPCFYYYLHRCPGVCIGKISLDEYRLQLDRICDFLNGNTAKIRSELKLEMRRAAAAHLFEKAARIRDQLQSLELLEERQIAIMPKLVSWDIVSLATGLGHACVNLFKVRNGKLYDKENFVFEGDANVRMQAHANDANLETEIIQKFLEKYYLETSDVPKTIYTQTPAQDGELIEHIIKSRFNRRAQVLAPQKGKPLELVKLGRTNAEEYLKKWLADKAGHLDKINQALQQLRDILRLPNLPQRIECYDISNIQGTNAVGSMVVFEKGLPKKNEYRKFKIRSKQTPDDFAMMQEMLERRLQRIRNKELGITKKTNWPIPDLIIIDGGKGQLGVAASLIHNAKFTIPVIGLAKRIEEIFLPNKPDPIILSHDEPALQLLQRIRDEAHRFGITFHRQLRSKQAVRSALDDIPGIGPKTKKLLKQKFGTVAQIRKAPFNDLVKVVGERIARVIAGSL